MNREGEGGKSGFLYLLHVFRETTKLDVWDLNFFFSDPDALEWSLIDLESRHVRYRSGFFAQTAVFFGRFTRCFFRFITWKSDRMNLDKPIVLLGLTKNQVDSLKPLAKELGEQAILLDGRSNSVWNAILLLGYLCSLLFFPFAIFDYIESKDIKRKGICVNFAFHWFTYGLYSVVRNVLHGSLIEGIVLSNDHIMENRVVMRAAQDQKIKTFYIQHASVTRCFPPLSMDQALLDGIDALTHYEAAGTSDTITFLTGSPKFDEYYHCINHSSQVTSIGICQNLYDHLLLVEQLCAELRSRFPMVQISLRIHPREVNRAEWEELADRYQMRYSDSLSEGIYDFLQNVDMLIAGNSNVHLEATLLNVYSIFFDLSADKRHQYYSFVQNGLCEELKTIISVCDLVDTLIKTKPDIRSRAKRYVDTIDTSFDGHSTDLAVRVIRETIFQGKVDMSIWQPVFETSKIAFRLMNDQKATENSLSKSR